MEFKAFAANVGLAESEFLELVELFYETSLEDLNMLETAWQQGESSKVVEAAHSIKGAAINLGFEEIFKLAKKIELQARGNSFEEIAANVAAIQGQLQDLAHILSQSRSDNGEHGTSL